MTFNKHGKSWQYLLQFDGLMTSWYKGSCKLVVR